MELNTLYEHLYDLDLHLQTDDSLDVFKAGFSLDLGHTCIKVVVAAKSFTVV
jgi:hypothetical protein